MGVAVRTTIETWTGKLVDPLNVDEDDICIEDIAHSLSRQARYLGHTSGHLSVARHSLWVADYLSDEEPETRVWGLLHDAAETYIGDMPSPLKHRPEMRRFRQAETTIELAIASHFGLRWPVPTPVFEADDKIKALECSHERYRYEGVAWNDEEDFLEEFERLSSRRAMQRLNDQAEELGLYE